MTLFNGALDRLATDLSKFTEPAIPELTLRNEETLQNYLTDCMFGSFGGESKARARHIMTNIVRRVFASIENYNLGRHHALDYIAGDHRAGRVWPYFLSLTHFESCIGYTWQVYDLLNKVGGRQVFTRGDNSQWERLHALYTEGTKHSATAIAERPHPPTTIWLTNDAVMCLTGKSVTFQEITEMINETNDVFYAVRDKVREKRQSRSNDAAT